jgi:hypothetical protein
MVAVWLSECVGSVGLAPILLGSTASACPRKTPTRDAGWIAVTWYVVSILGECNWTTNCAPPYGGVLRRSR